MGLSFDFIILTMNNRGTTSALDLIERGFKVAWLDVSEKTCWASKDFSGPLPFHVRRDADEKDKRRLLSVLQAKKLPQGLSLITEEAVLELKGQISEYQRDQFKQNDDLNRLHNSYSPKMSALSKNLKDHWLVHFFSAYNKSVIDEDSLAPKQTLNVSDVFGETYLATENFAHRQKNRKSLESKGVEILDPNHFEIRVEAEKYYIKNSSDEISSASQMLCFLEASDLQKIDPEFSQQVFYKKPLESSWSWTRLDLQWQTSLDISSIPDILVLLNHWDLPWLEDNFMIMRKSIDQSWGLWVKVKKEPRRIPQELIEQFVVVLNKHFPLSEFSLSQSEKEKGLDLQLFPVYQEKPEVMVKKGIHFYPMGFDKYESFDLFDMFQNQKNFIDQLTRSSS